MAEEKQNQDDFFNESNEITISWMKFEKVGDSIKGTLTGVSEKPMQDIFPAQIIYEIKKEDGAIVNVGINKNKIFIHSAMKNAKIGQIVGFLYHSDYQTDENKKKGLNPAKTIKAYLGKMDEEYIKEQENKNEMVDMAGEPPVPDFLK